MGLVNSSYVLPLLILLPVAGALWISLVGPKQRCCVAKLALVFSGVTFLASLVMLVQFVQGGMGSGFSQQFYAEFLPKLGSSFHLGVDGISLWLILLTNFLTPLAILGSFSGIGKSPRTYYSLMLLLQAGMSGVF